MPFSAALIGGNGLMPLFPLAGETRNQVNVSPFLKRKDALVRSSALPLCRRV